MRSLKGVSQPKHGDTIPAVYRRQPLRQRHREQLDPALVNFTEADTILGEEVVKLLMCDSSVDELGDAKLVVCRC